ncbi:MAG: polyphosphate kinase 2 [Campylobacterales bacterium]|nr:polyphosphate kinase 2 [Campylobacterales bacterium]
MQMPLTPAQEEEALLSYEETLLLEPYQAELVKLQQHIEKHQLKLVVLFEGRDAAGKGSVIGSVSRYMNPKHYKIIALGKPTQEEKTQWYFQRYVKHLPDAGKVILFDRSWYNRAMVEPVFGFCTQKEYELFMKYVVPFEQAIIEEGTTVLKLYFSVTKDKQSLRFEQRRTDPLRQWKLSEIDLQAQSMWGQFTDVKYQMLKQTSHDLAPWNVIRSDDKHRARVETMKLILSQIDYEGKNRNLDYTIDKEIVFTASEELALMKKNKMQ